MYAKPYINRIANQFSRITFQLNSRVYARNLGCAKAVTESNLIVIYLLYAYICININNIYKYTIYI